MHGVWANNGYGVKEEDGLQRVPAVYPTP
jgi:hypothetical protein